MSSSALSCSATIQQPTAGKADFPVPRTVILAAERGPIKNGKLYVASGYGSNKLDVYDPATNKWTTKASLPAAREWTAGAGGGSGGNCTSWAGRVRAPLLPLSPMTRPRTNG